MSGTNSTTDTQKSCVDAQEKPEDGGNDHTDKDSSLLGGSPEKSEIQRVLKEVGITSTNFIGPEFPPATAKSNIDDTLDEFYKEIEMIDTPRAAEDNSGETDFLQLRPPPVTSAGTNCVDRDKGNKVAIPFKYQQSSGERASSWSHWYQNEPYFHRRPRESMDLMHSPSSANQNHWHHSETVDRPRPHNLRHYGPARHDLPAFPYPENAPWRENQSRGGSAMTVQHPHFPTPQNLPPSNVSCRSSQFPLRDPQEDRSFLAHSGHDVNAGLSRDRKQQWYHLDDGYDRRDIRDSENRLWNYRSQTPDTMNPYRSTLVLILMRGLPGSGKSTLARELLFSGPDGLILSTDDYFVHRDGYHYDPGRLGEAHEWNQSRAKYAMHEGRSPIIIDNTNIQAWEMKPYVRMALAWGYSVDFCEPNTNWKFDPYELEKRNKHGVPHHKIAQMMDHFSFPISVDIVMSSQEPLHVNQRRLKQNQTFH